MDGPYFGLHGEKPLVTLLRDVQQVRIGIGRPAGITVRMSDFGAGEPQHRLDGLCGITLGALHRRTLRRSDHDPLGTELHRCQIRRGLDQPFDGVRHRQHAVRQTDERPDERLHRHGIEYPFDPLDFVQGHLQIGFGVLELLDDLDGERTAALAHVAGRLGGNAEDGERLARNGVAQVAAVETVQHRPVGQQLVKQPRHQLVGVGAPLLDVVARMAAGQPLDVDTEIFEPVGRRRHHRAEFGHGIHAAGAADKEFALVLRIEVDEVLPRQHPLAQPERSRQAGLFVDGEERFERRMRDGRGGQHRQCGSHADPVVGAERRPLGTHPPVVDAGADRVVLEVERHVRIFLTDHIHMRLENHRRTPFVTGRRRFADHDVARLVAPVLQSVLLRPAYQVVAYLLFLLRGPRYARDRLEFRPHLAGCEFRQICHLCFGLNMHKITKEYPF